MDDAYRDELEPVPEDGEQRERYDAAEKPLPLHVTDREQIDPNDQGEDWKTYRAFVKEGDRPLLFVDREWQNDHHEYCFVWPTPHSLGTFLDRAADDPFLPADHDMDVLFTEGDGSGRDPDEPFAHRTVQGTLDAVQQDGRWPEHAYQVDAYTGQWAGREDDDFYLTEWSAENEINDHLNDAHAHQYLIRSTDMVTDRFAAWYRATQTGYMPDDRIEDVIERVQDVLEQHTWSG